VKWEETIKESLNLHSSLFSTYSNLAAISKEGMIIMMMGQSNGTKCDLVMKIEAVGVLLIPSST
jgi:hypothetical protein